MLFSHAVHREGERQQRSTHIYIYMYVVVCVCVFFFLCAGERECEIGKEKACCVIHFVRGRVDFLFFFVHASLDVCTCSHSHILCVTFCCVFSFLTQCTFSPPLTHNKADQKKHSLCAPFLLLLLYNWGVCAWVCICGDVCGHRARGGGGNIYIYISSAFSCFCTGVHIYSTLRMFRSAAAYNIAIHIYTFYIGICVYAQVFSLACFRVSFFFLYVASSYVCICAC